MSDDEPVSSSSEENDDEISPKSSNSNQNDDEDTEDEDEEEDEELSDSDKTSSLENSCESPIIEVDNPKDNMNNSRIDSDGTTNSYSSLEDEEVLRDDNILEEVIVERTYLDDANGNNVIWKTNTGIDKFI